MKHRREEDYKCTNCHTHFCNPLPPREDFEAEEPICAVCGSELLRLPTRLDGVRCTACGAEREQAADNSDFSNMTRKATHFDWVEPDDLGVTDADDDVHAGGETEETEVGDGPGEDDRDAIMSAEARELAARPLPRPEDLRTIREALDLSLREAGGEAEASDNTIHRWESGATSPSLNRVETLLAFYRSGDAGSLEEDTEARELATMPLPTAADLRTMRESLELSLREVPTAARRTIGSWERGERSPSLDRLRELLQYYRVVDAARRASRLEAVVDEPLETREDDETDETASGFAWVGDDVVDTEERPEDPDETVREAAVGSPEAAGMEGEA